jgi:hypothetical protein
MAENEALLQQIRGYAKASRLSFTRHARERMGQRGVGEQDVRKALVHANRCQEGNEPNRWKVTGPDVDGDALDIVVVIDDGLLIITVM